MNYTDSLKGKSRPVAGSSVTTRSKMPYIIGITGKARSGKDTVADMLVERLARFSKESFAAPIKDMIRAGFSLNDKQDMEAIEYYGCTHRRMLQTLGTEWGRKLINPEIWLIVAMNRHEHKRAIFSDVRFENEAEWVRKNGILIHIERKQAEKIATPDHASEAGVTFKGDDIRILNEGSLEFLSDQVHSLIDTCLSKRVDFPF
jgi:hypothetical protein